MDPVTDSFFGFVRLWILTPGDLWGSIFICAILFLFRNLGINLFTDQVYYICTVVCSREKNQKLA